MEKEKTEREQKGLLLYFSSADQLFKMTDSQLGEFVKKELSWYMGETEEPIFEDARMDCMHSRIIEQVELRGYNARKQRESRARKAAEELKKKEQEAQPKTKKEVLTQKQKEDLIKWYGVLSTKDNDRYFNSSWNQFFDDYETAKIAANDYLRNNLRTYKGWLM